MSEEEYRGKVFKSGNSVALRLPKALGLTEGTDVRMVREGPLRFRVEPIDAPKRKIDISKFVGKAPGMQPLTRKERDFDDSSRPWDDPDWPHLRTDDA